MEDKYPYKIWDRYGELVLQAKEDCRYSKEIERGLLEHGYTIKLHGQKITKTTIKKENMK
jgi:hypothetical protein